MTMKQLAALVLAIGLGLSWWSCKSASDEYEDVGAVMPDEPPMMAGADEPPSFYDCAPNGGFHGDVVARWLDDRRMELTEPFCYQEPGSGRMWNAPRGAVVNGASIPRALWTMVGSPFTGEYRRASVVHDVGCQERTSTWQEVHRMFYSACLCGGVGKLKAKIMFAAVYHFGPRWSLNGDVFSEARDTLSEEEESDFSLLSQQIEQEDMSIEEIEAFVFD